jgi:hypothetical protein
MLMRNILNNHMFPFLIRETHLGEIRTAQNLSFQPRYLIGVRIQ